MNPLAVLPLVANTQLVAPPLQNNDFALEVFQGPLTAPIRVTGLGGAYAASPEGVEGNYVNAAAPSVRDSFSYRWFDYDVNLSLSLPGAYSKTDFQNTGSSSSANPNSFSNFLMLSLGLTLQFGPVGVSGNTDFQQVSIASSSSELPDLNLQILRSTALISFAFFDEQLHVGAGIRAVTLRLGETDNVVRRPLLTMSGVGPEMGALLKLIDRPWRIGATIRSPVSGRASHSSATTNIGGVDRVGGLILPDTVTLPWEAEVGIAYQLGPRPLNPRWINPRDEEGALRRRFDEARRQREFRNAQLLAGVDPENRSAVIAHMAREEITIASIEEDALRAESDRFYRVRRARFNNWPREKILFLASVLMTGPSVNAIGIQGFLDQTVERSGEKYTFSPRFGVEAEPVEDRFRARIGSYFEPARLVGSIYRQHFTFGGDIKLFPFNAWGFFGETMWRFSFAADIAPRFFNWSVGIGVWH